MSWKIFETTTVSFLLLGLYFKASIFINVLEILVISVMVIGLYQKNTNSMCKSKKNLYGRTVIVTGGTSGMGLEIASDFAHRGAKVIIACPFEDEGLNAKKIIERKSKNDKVIFKLLDLSSFRSVRQFAADILETEDRLDILLNNAGVGLPGDFLTSDGLNFIMQVNYYGTFLLTILLLPLLRKTGQLSEPSRIVNTSSALQKFGKIDLENWNRTNYWMHAVDPGLVGTPIFRSVRLSLGTVWTFLIGILFKNPWEGSQTALYVCLSDTVGKTSGKYFRNLKSLPLKRGVYDDELSKRIWEKTIEIVKLKQDELKACHL